YPRTSYLYTLSLHDALPILASLAQSLKNQLPFTFRYQVPKADGTKELNLQGVPRTASALVGKMTAALGPGWQATLFVSHIILYRSEEHTSELQSRFDLVCRL